MNNPIILVVDDEILNLIIHIELLTKMNPNFEILQANSGKLALEIINKKRPNLILLDWEMPDINGIDVINEIRKDKNNDDIAIIIITGMMTSAENLKTALDSGAIDFMRKPIDQVEFTARIKAMLKFTEYYNTKVESELKINKLLKDQIDFKDRELASSTLFMTTLNNEVLSIISDLNSIINNFDKKKLNNIIQNAIKNLELKANTNIWEDFRIRFEQVHPDFMKNLLVKSDDLSPTEQKLAILLRLNLSTKEIADILSIQAESVKTARSRLRKKLNINQDINIINYLSKI